MQVLFQWNDLTTVFVNTRLWKTKHPRKRFRGCFVFESRVSTQTVVNWSSLPGLYQREQKIICLYPEYHIFDDMNLVFTWCLSSIISCASSSSSENFWSAWEASHPSAILNFYLCPVFSIATVRQRRPGEDRYLNKERARNLYSEETHFTPEKGECTVLCCTLLGQHIHTCALDVDEWVEVDSYINLRSVRVAGRLSLWSFNNSTRRHVSLMFSHFSISVARSQNESLQCLVYE